MQNAQFVFSANKPDLMHRSLVKTPRAQVRMMEKSTKDEGSNYREQYIAKGSMGCKAGGEKGEQDCMIKGSVALLEFIYISFSCGLFLNIFLYYYGALSHLRSYTTSGSGEFWGR